jgi:beta-glucanase (GH16 family)
MMYSRDKDAQRRIQLVESDIEKQNLIYQSYEGYVDSGRQIFTKEKQLEGEKYFNDFHIYALKWSPEKIEFFIDGNMTHSVGRELRTSEKKYLYASLEL